MDKDTQIIRLRIALVHVRDAVMTIERRFRREAASLGGAAPDYETPLASMAAAALSGESTMLANYLSVIIRDAQDALDSDKAATADAGATPSEKGATESAQRSS